MKVLVTATTFHYISDTSKSKLIELGFNVDAIRVANFERNKEESEKLETIEIEIDTLEYLKSFLSKQIECVVWVKDDVLNIEIYNDRRE